MNTEQLKEVKRCVLWITLASKLAAIHAFKRQHTVHLSHLCLWKLRMGPQVTLSNASSQSGMGAGSKRLTKDSTGTECNTIGVLPNLSDIFTKVSMTKHPS